MHPLEVLLQYAEFRALLQLAAIACFVVVVWVLIIMLIHTAAVLGQHTVLYGKQSPSRQWSKHFYLSAFILLGILWGLTVWLRHVAQL